MSVFNNFGPRQTSNQRIEYSQFIADVKQHRIKRVLIRGNVIDGYL
jgi:ATP-dependent Zn protease